MLQICPLGLCVFNNNVFMVYKIADFSRNFCLAGSTRVAKRCWLYELSDITATEVILGRFMPASRLTGSDLA